MKANAPVKKISSVAQQLPPSWTGKAIRKSRLLILLAAFTLAVAAACVALLQGQNSGGTLRAQAVEPQRVSLPRLPAPDLLRALTPDDAKAANAERPIVERRYDPAASFRLTGQTASRLRAVECLTQAIYYEAASEGVDGGRAVAQVVLNRLRHPGYPNSVCGVVYEGSARTSGCQFSFTCDGSLAKIPIAYLWKRSRRIASEALAGRVFGPVGHATHYHADYVLPYWADSLDKAAVVGRHIFYSFRGKLGAKAAFHQGYADEEPAPPSPPPSLELIDPAQLSIAPEATTEAMSILEADKLIGLQPREKASTQQTTSLKADQGGGVLILGGSSAAKTKVEEPAKCPKGGVGQMKPLEANNLKFSSSSSGC
ncbi:cell wall hydrolase [Sphingomonas piscis]|uniref:Cell wall hydrolase n=1 Tax=Sphingomonas piscis TaxID=2714943 RepID=A0A6G7YQV1_9SPHN|nr:cell wall hydrolase [Sphingomonas piscis]QIK79120.1 cell wall hydrolase [Sphingomonas piscis]